MNNWVSPVRILKMGVGVLGRGHMKKLVSLFLGSILMLPFIEGCAAHGRVYVRSYGPAEAPYYNRWERESRREHMEYERRRKAEQNQYWNWRRHHDHD